MMTVGLRHGTQFLLAEGKENRIGRGLDCDVILSDPLSSRVHAIVTCEDGDWWVRDSASRNGTFVNDQKIDEARLMPGVILKVGSTEFEFHQSPTKPSDTSRFDHTQTLIHDRVVVAPEQPGEFGLDALRDNERAHDFLTLHQLSMKLLGCSDPDEVVQVSLELLRERTKASVVGFLWASDDGQLKPKLVIPEDAAGKVQLSGELTELVIRQGKAIWIDNQDEDEKHTPQHFADAICVPLVHAGVTHPQAAGVAATVDRIDRWLGASEGERTLLATSSPGHREMLLELLRGRGYEPHLYSSWQDFLAGDAPLGIAIAEIHDGFRLAERKLRVITATDLGMERPKQRPPRTRRTAVRRL